MTAPRIDAHQHFWRLARADYGWLTPELGALYRDFEPGDLEPLLRASGVESTVLVQAAATVEETRFLLSLADRHDWIRGVVGWIDFDRPRAGVESLAELGGHARFVGVRPMVQDIPDVGWLLRPSHGPVWEAITSRGLAFDALVRPAHLESLARVLGARPDLRCVIDHAGKPEIGAGASGPGFGAWGGWMRRIARESAAWCKLSGLITEASGGWSVDDLRPFVDVLLEAFGPGRLIWGSDWPVLNLAGDYAKWLEATRELLSGLSDSERADVLGANAIRAYRLEGARA